MSTECSSSGSPCFVAAGLALLVENVMEENIEFRTLIQTINQKMLEMMRVRDPSTNSNERGRVPDSPK